MRLFTARRGGRRARLYSPPRYLNYDSRDDAQSGSASRAITVAVQMRPGGYIGQFGEDIDAKLAELRNQLPDDLVMARTLRPTAAGHGERDLFMDSLYEGDHPGSDRYH